MENWQQVIDLLYCALERSWWPRSGLGDKETRMGTEVSWEASAGIHEGLGEGEGVVGGGWERLVTLPWLSFGCGHVVRWSPG